MGLVFWLAAKGYWPGEVDWSVLPALIGIAGSIDSYRIARRYKDEFSGPWYTRWVGLAVVLVSMAFVAICIRAFVVEPYRIPSTSMAPTLLVGDFIVVNKFRYGLRLPLVHYKIVDNAQPMRGDVLVFRYPENPSLSYIKRVIGVPGDTVAYRAKRLRLNGEEVQIEILGEFTYDEAGGNMATAVLFMEQLPGLLHSILIHPHAPVIQLVGVRDFPYRDQCIYDEGGFECKVPPGHYFVMGDNRDRTSDSRYWGFVPEENIAGKAVMIWWNEDEPRRTGRFIK